jgi:ABC-type nitrate/sulfonate/bicarbonate transport system ATPase subunit
MDNGVAIILDINIRAKHRDGRIILQDLQFSLGTGEIVALVGPSGCGKTTLLRIIGGLDPAFEGEITGSPGTIGTVFQEPRLLPWRTVHQNIALANPPDPAAADALLDALGLAGVQDAWPGTLSTGMARRVAIARAFAIEPGLVLLDEPFVSLDPDTAERSRAILVEAWRMRRCAALLVTHDMAEAASLADRILTLSTSPARVVAEFAIPQADRRQGIAVGARVAASYFSVAR